MLFSPLEQFQIISIFPINFFCLDFSFTNLVLINFILFLLIGFSVNYFSTKSNNFRSFFFVPGVWQTSFEIVYEIVTQLVYDNLNVDGEKYLPYISTLFTFILFNNLIGLVPYSFTITSHLIVTFTLSLSVFIGIFIIGCQRHKIKMLSVFLPANTSFFLALLLVPIEFVSYFFKPISLGVRLFANLMAGHTLLKVIVGFSWSLLMLEELFSVIHVIPLLILVLLMGLELGVALIQAYVFIVLTCIYLNDSLNLSH